MKKTFTAFLALFTSLTAQAAYPSPVIFSGIFARTIPSQFSINELVRVLTGTVDPTSVAQDAPKGSLYMRYGSSGGTVYYKTDDGNSTNWKAVGTASGGTFATTTFTGVTTFPGSTTIDGSGNESVGGTLGVTGVFTASNTTDATSSTAAGSIVSGGLAVAKKANIGTTLTVGTTSQLTGNVNIGIASSNAATVQIHNATNDRRLQLSDDGTSAIIDSTYGSSGGHPLLLQVTDVTGITIDTSQNTQVAGVLTAQSTTDSSSSITGGGIFSGGLGIAKKLFVGTSANIAGTTQHTGNVGIGAASSAQSQLQITSPTTVTGTNTNSASGTSVTGTGTNYLTEFHIGDTITMNSETQTITAITSDTALTTSAWTGANTGVTATRAALADVFVYPNGNTQVGGSRTHQTNILNSGFGQSVVASAPSSGATSVSSALFGVFNYSGASAATTSNLVLLKSRGTEAAPVTISSGDAIGLILFRGYDGSVFNGTSSSIQVNSTELFSASAHGTKMILRTTPNTTTTLTTALTLDQDQSATFAGAIKFANVLASPTAPTITSGGCTSSGPAIAANNGPSAFTITVGTTCTGSQPIVIGLPTAASGWVCNGGHRTAAAATGVIIQTSTGTASVTLTNSILGTASAWTTGETIQVSCFAY